MIGLGERIDALLAPGSPGATVTPSGPGRWALTLTNGAMHEGVAIARGDWLQIELPLADGDGWDLLRRNAGLGAGVKFATSPTTGDATLVGELPLRTDATEAAVEAMWRSLHAALDDDPAATPNEPRPTGDRERCASLCAEIGWAPRTDDDGSCRVALPSSRSACAAVLAMHGDGSIHAGVTIASTDEPLPKPCAAALAGHLMRAGGVTRAARVAVVDREDTGGHAVRFEAATLAPADPPRLAQVLEALSVMCDLHAPETVLLHEDEVVAAGCLDAWEPRSLASCSRPTLFPV